MPFYHLSNRTFINRDNLTPNLQHDLIKRERDQWTTAYHKGIGSDYVEHCNSQKSLWIISSSLLENFSCDGHGGVHRITDQVDNGSWTTLCNPFTQSLDNSCVYFEQIIPRHSWFSRNTCRDYNKIHASKRSLQLLLPQESTHLNFQKYS